MGKRKKASKPPPKGKAPKVDKVFDCPFCGQDKSVECEIDHKGGIGTVSCSNCGAAHRKEINSLEAPIDVFHDWVDRAIEVTRAEED